MPSKLDIFIMFIVVIIATLIVFQIIKLKTEVVEIKHLKTEIIQSERASKTLHRTSF